MNRIDRMEAGECFALSAPPLSRGYLKCEILGLDVFQFSGAGGGGDHGISAVGSPVRAGCPQKSDRGTRSLRWWTRLSPLRLTLPHPSGSSRSISYSVHPVHPVEMHSFPCLPCAFWPGGLRTGFFQVSTLAKLRGGASTRDGCLVSSSCLAGSLGHGGSPCHPFVPIEAQNLRKASSSSPVETPATM